MTSLRITNVDDVEDLFVDLFFNSGRNDHLHGLIDAGSLAFRDVTQFHTADGRKTAVQILDDDAQELEFVIRSRRCVIDARQAVQDAAACLRKFAAELVQCAETMEAEEQRRIKRRQEWLATAKPPAKAVTA